MRVKRYKIKLYNEAWLSQNQVFLKFRFIVMHKQCHTAQRNSDSLHLPETYVVKQRKKKAKLLNKQNGKIKKKMVDAYKWIWWIMKMYPDNVNVMKKSHLHKKTVKQKDWNSRLILVVVWFVSIFPLITQTISVQKWVI